MIILAAFSSYCCYEFWLPFPPASAEAFTEKEAPGWENTMAAKDGKASELRPKTP